MNSPIQFRSSSHSLLLELDVKGNPEKERLASFFVNLISWYHDEHSNKPLSSSSSTSTSLHSSITIHSTNHIRLSCEHYFQQHPIYNLKTIHRSSFTSPQPLSPSPHGSLRSTNGSGVSPTNSLNVRSLPIHSPPGSLGGQGMKRYEMATYGSSGSINRSTGNALTRGGNSSLEGVRAGGLQMQFLPSDCRVPLG